MNLSQEELAEKIYVTRQTVSNWENEKSYPDIHSLLLLSTLFNISLDQLIKGDIDIMKKEIKKSEITKINHYGTIFTILFIASIILFVPLVKFLTIYGIIIWAILYMVTFIFGFKIEKLKKNNDIHTYKEIVAFSQGKHLDEIQKQREVGKRPYQAILMTLFAAVTGFIITALMFWLFKNIPNLRFFG